MHPTSFETHVLFTLLTNFLLPIEFIPAAKLLITGGVFQQQSYSLQGVYLRFRYFLQVHSGSTVSSEPHHGWWKGIGLLEINGTGEVQGKKA